jgi:hypothetical protein
MVLWRVGTKAIFEGHIDFDMRDSIRDVQVKFSMIPDGNPNEGLLKALGIKRL